MADINLEESSTEPLGQNDILEALKDDLEETTEEVKPEPESTEETGKDTKEEEQEEDETEEEKIELEDKEEEELEYQEVPKRAAIKAAYPDIFKKFPGLEQAIYREYEYTKIFPSLKEAESAKETIDLFGQIQDDLFKGNIGNLLSSIKKQDEKAFNKISGNLLQTLAAVDKQSFFDLTDTVTKHAINSVFTAGKEKGDDQLQLAAQILHEFLYGNRNVTGPKARQAEEREDPQAEALKKEKFDFEKKKLDAAVESVVSRTNSIIRTAVEKYIDPKGYMGDYVKRQAIKDVIDAVDKEIGGDERFRMDLDRLWRNAESKNYSDASKELIRKAIIKKAQSILPNHIKKIRADVSKGTRSSQNTSRRVKEENDDQPVIRRTATPERTRSSNNDRPSKVGSVRDVMKFLE